MIIKNARANLFVYALSALTANTSWADITVTEKKFYTGAYAIENDEQAKDLIAILKEMVAKDLTIARYHYKSAVEGYVESLRNYVLTNYKTPDVSRIGVTEKELHEIQTRALNQLACNDLKSVNQNIVASNSRGAMGKLKLYEKRIARARIHSGELRSFDSKEKVLQCEISSQDLVQLNEKIQNKKTQLDMSSDRPNASVSQASEKTVSTEMRRSASLKDQTSTVGK